MKYLINFLLLQTFLIHQCRTWLFLHRGRSLHRLFRFQSTVLPPNEYWFTQPVDHFNLTDKRTWKQRYFVNDEHYKPSEGKTIFLLISGEESAPKRFIKQGTWIKYAKRFGALCFLLEHRYYGKSRPTEDMSTSNLKYLTSKQALEDVANFIVGMNKNRNLTSDTKWITFGGSYGGSLAAWSRLKFPHLVFATVSSSAPLLLQVEFSDYYSNVAKALRTHSRECIQAIEAGTAEIQSSLRTKEGQQNVTKKFVLCDPIEELIKNPKDVANLYLSLAGNFAGVVQYNKVNQLNQNAETANLTIRKLCTIMINKDMGAPIDRLATVNHYLAKIFGGTCLEYKYNSTIADLGNIDFSNKLSGARQWTYQTCTEFGLYQTSSGFPQIFGNEFSLKFYVDECIDLFGPKYNSTFIDEAVNITNGIYGGLHINITKVVFVQGSLDPWHTLGMLKTASKIMPQLYIHGTSHCADAYPESENDLTQLQRARKAIENYLDTWINK